MSKKTVVLGASPNPTRFSYKCVIRLRNYEHEVVPIGIRKGNIEGIEIDTNRGHYENIDTITLYLNAERQKEYYDYIFSLNPKRIIFNPGTYNPELKDKAKEHNIDTIEMCTLVMLSTNNY